MSELTAKDAPKDKDDILLSDEYDSFEDWMECFLETHDVCGAKHFKHYGCYFYNEDCDDPNWHDCYWLDMDCDGDPLEDLLDEYDWELEDQKDEYYWELEDQELKEMRQR